MKYRIAFKQIALVLVLIFLAIISITFSTLYLKQTKLPFISNNKRIITILIFVIITVVTVIGGVFQFFENNFSSRVSLIFMFFISIAYLFLFLTKKYDLESKISNVSDLRNLVKGYGRFTIPIFISLQFLQVIILPIPSIIILGAGITLFGVFLGGLFSYIGILTASIIAFLIGRFLGNKVVEWIIGKKNYKKVLSLVKNKDKIVLTLMFIFPLN